MKSALFSTKPHDRRFFDAANERHHHEIASFEARLTCDTAPPAAGSDAVCPFVNDVADRRTVDCLAGHQGFFTVEALEAIAETTLANVTAFAEGRRSGNELGPSGSGRAPASPD